MKSRHLFALVVCMLFSALAVGLEPPQPGADVQQPSSTDGAASKPSSGQNTTIKVNVRVVPVRVVVRDSAGHAIGGLKSNDFEIYDNGKLQEIRQFSAETVEPSGESAVGALKQSTNAPQPKALPQRYLAYVFDDIHLNLADVKKMEATADHHLSSLQAGDRIAVFSASGKVSLDFTDNRDMVKEALQRVSPHPIGNPEARGCPAISHYMADLIVNKQDEDAAGEAIEDAFNCAYAGFQQAGMAAEAMANTEAEYQLRIGDMETDAVLHALDVVIRRMSQLPGQRNLVLISPGFFVSDSSHSRLELLDNAVRSNVIISALDTRGLYALPRSGGMSSDAAAANTQVMTTLTDATGGVYFHNKNDADEGFRVTADSPEYSYVLSFSPQGFKPDGRFHAIKVVVKSGQKYNIQARRGYYAPKGNEEAVQVASSGVHVQSAPNRNDIPVELETQLSSSGSKRKLTITANVGVNHLHFRKKDGRNVDELTMISSLFDDQGKYLKGDKKNVHLHVTDDALKNQLNDGLPLSAEFDLPTGNYQLRVSVEDADGMMTNLEKAVVVR